MPAEKIFWLMGNDEIADRRRSRVQSRANLVERRAEGRRVADERQRLQVREPPEPLVLNGVGFE